MIDADYRDFTIIDTFRRHADYHSHLHSYHLPSSSAITPPASPPTLLPSF